VTYEELEALYDQFDQLCGTSESRHLNGGIQPAEILRGGAMKEVSPIRDEAENYGQPLSAKRGEAGYHSITDPPGICRTYVLLGRAVGCVYVLRLL